MEDSPDSGQEKKSRSAVAFLKGISFGGEPEATTDDVPETDESEGKDHPNTSLSDDKKARYVYVTKENSCPISRVSFLRSLDIRSSLPQMDQRVNSYQHLLKPDSSIMSRDPNFLDDPDILSTTLRQIVSLSGYITSVIPFVTEKALKSDLNRQFRQQHSYVDTSMSLSKLRSLKRSLREIAFEQEEILEVGTVALCHFLLDRLVVKNVVTKQNRKLLAATCALLAAKFIESRSLSSGYIKQLLEVLEKVFEVSKKKILEKEIWVFAEVEFGLLVPTRVVLSHFLRLFRGESLSAQEYLGEEMFKAYFPMSFS